MCLTLACRQNIKIPSRLEPLLCTIGLQIISGQIVSNRSIAIWFSHIECTTYIAQRSTRDTVDIIRWHTSPKRAVVEFHRSGWSSVSGSRASQAGWVVASRRCWRYSTCRFLLSVPWRIPCWPVQSRRRGVLSQRKTDMKNWPHNQRFSGCPTLNTSVKSTFGNSLGATATIHVYQANEFCSQHCLQQSCNAVKCFFNIR